MMRTLHNTETAAIWYAGEVDISPLDVFGNTFAAWPVEMAEGLEVGDYVRVESRGGSTAPRLYEFRGVRPVKDGRHTIPAMYLRHPNA